MERLIVEPWIRQRFDFGIERNVTPRFSGIGQTGGKLTLSFSKRLIVFGRKDNVFEKAFDGDNPLLQWFKNRVWKFALLFFDRCFYIY
ncbi:hypothetical protein [Methyloraptor flagellatus]|uniref:Uncharacterized protein n=1 Tax=Methyloraptor flagellatus TaxID=3162530 RepID=A0AAU7XAW0_9HYPH